MADDVQPAEGQGEGGQGLYDLESVPEEYREHVEPHLKAMEGNVTKRFQEAADYRKQWGPYEELGINDIDPEQLKALLDFAELAQDDDRLSEWWKAVGEQKGWMDNQTDDLDLGDLEGLSAEDVKKVVSEQLAEKLQPVYETLTQSQQKQAEQEAATRIQGELDALKGEHGEDIDTDAILQLAYAYVDEDPDGAIGKGFEDYKRLVGKGEANLFADKSKQPPPVEGQGAADTTPPRITTFEEAKAAARERMKQAAAT